MPYSSNSGKQKIQEWISKLNAKTVIDIGAGAGSYIQFKTYGQHWTAVEVWTENITKFQLQTKYDFVINADARKLNYKNYDLAILGDVLEHMTKDEAIALVDKLKKVCRTVIVSIPIGYYPQDEYEGNPYEKHITDNWTTEDFENTFGKPTAKHIENEIGVFMYKKLKIAVYAISKNEEQFVQRFCESAKEADHILIADTGSSDNTVEVARACGATVHEIAVMPWRFDMARDTALCLLPRDIDVCISLDLDEMLEPGWREEIEKVWKDETTRLRYKFDWGCGISFYYEKIHHRNGYRWHHPCHEYPKPDPRTKEVYAHTDMLLVSHHPDPTKSRGQYLDLLTVAVKEDPQCPRNAFYYARELTFHYKWREAIEALDRYLNLPEATWINERCYAMRLMGKCYEHLNEGWAALKWLRLACAEAPNTREPWVELAMLTYRYGMWEESYAAATTALKIVDKQAVYTMDPSVWTEKPYDLASIAAWNLGMKETAMRFCKQALEFAPDDTRLRNNLRMMEDGR